MKNVWYACLGLLYILLMVLLIPFSFLHYVILGLIDLGESVWNDGL